MPDSMKPHPVSRFLAIAAAVVLIVWGISMAQSVLVSVLVSVFLAVLATPPVFWLERRRVPVVIAVLLIVASMVTILLAVGAVVGASINGFLVALPHYQARIQEHLVSLRDFLASKGIAPPEAILLEYVNPGALMNLTAGLFVRLGSALSNIVLIVLTSTFILLEATSFPGKLRAVLGDPKQVFPKITTFVDDMKRYMVIKTLINFVTAILITVWLSILGVDYPVLWGFLAFLLNYVPTLGPAIAMAPAVLFAALQLGPLRGVLTAAGYLVINFAIAYGVEIRLMGRKLGLSMLVVFLSLIFWRSLLGPVGAVLCIPLTMSFKYAFESNESTKWIAVLLGPEEVAKPRRKPATKAAKLEDAKAA